MRFPDKDKLRRAKIMLKEQGFKGEEGSDKYWFEICEIYENILGGKVLARPEKSKKKVKKSKPKPKPKKKVKKVKKAKKK